MRCILIIILIFITYSFQIVKGNEYVPQMVDKESAIIIRTDKKHIFLFNYFVDLQKKDFIINLFLLKKQENYCKDKIPFFRRYKEF